MPKIPHGSGMDGRERGMEHIREAGFGHWETRQGFTLEGRGPEWGRRPAEHVDWPREKGFLPAAAPPPSGDCSIGRWDFTLACQSGHVVSAGF